MTTIIRSSATAARLIVDKFSPAKTGSARICRSVTPAIFQPILRAKSPHSKCGGEVPSWRNSDRRYEKVLIKLVHRSRRSGWNGWLRADKAAVGAGEGGADRFAVRSNRLGRDVPR